MMSEDRRRYSIFKVFGFVVAVWGATACEAADLDITRRDGPAGPEVRIEVQMSLDRGPRTVVVPRDVTVVDRMLPGSADERTDGSIAEYYGLLRCDWAGLRGRLKTYLESNTRETLVFVMRNDLNSRGSLAQRLNYAFAERQQWGQLFFGVGGHDRLQLNETDRQKVRNGQQVTLPEGSFPEACAITGAEARALLESAIRVYERYTGVSRNPQ